ncbi:DNA polymerase-3 subunit epsilon [Paucibacter oligotrophus]|uniref:DNA polymerase-3 subunit epsilon n=1 Tax=Roseateles oligotrophus TaxID=1769250 RepID=A0A840L628_9BURK|nr:3'-5' exonuclease [Roseateles oligotrophus]MBB4842045.1 DNA polymerase-3 subunit epsilon [Roseateles oligotrophus]
MSVWAALKQRWLLYHLGLPEFAPMFGPTPADEWVSLDCETTGLDAQRDEIIAIGAVRIQGNRVLSSQRLELLVKPEKKNLTAAAVKIHGLREQDLAQGLDIDTAMRRLLHFIGPRPLVGYYLEFDVALINRAIFPMLGLRLPQPKIEISSLYYDWKQRQLPPYQQGAAIDLRLDTLMQDLGLPQRPAHNALNDAVMAALAFLKLRSLLAD